MKKIFSVVSLLLMVMMSFAQEVAKQTGAAQTDGESIPVNSVFFVMGVAVVLLFVFTIIYTLSKAVRALSTQINSK